MMDPDFVARLDVLFVDNPLPSTHVWGTDPAIDVERLPADVKFVVERHGGSNFQWKAPVGPDFLRYQRTMVMLHGEFGVGGSMAGNMVLVDEALTRWVECRDFPEVAIAWGESLVPVVWGLPGTFCLDYAFDGDEPPVVYVDSDWNPSSEGDVYPTRDTLNAVVYVASSLTEMMFNLVHPNDAVRGGLLEPGGLWVQSDQERAWLQHRAVMLGYE